MPPLCTKFWRFLVTEKFFLVELFTFSFYICLSISDLSTNFLIQDKICQLRYNQTTAFCQHLNAEAGREKDKILAAGTIFNIYRFVRNWFWFMFANWVNLCRSAIETTGLVVWSFFVGSYLDANPNGTRLLLSLVLTTNSLAYIYYLVNVFDFGLDAYFLLLGSLSTWASGGTITFFTTAYRYIVVHYGNGNNASIRFALFQLSARIGAALGSFLGGRLLSLEGSPVAREKLRTYHWCYIVVIGLNLMSFVIIFFMPNVKEEIKTQDNDIADEIVVSSVEDIPIEPTPPKKRRNPWQAIRQIFTLANIVKTFQSLFSLKQTSNDEEEDANKLREIRKKVLILFALMCLYKITFNGMDNVVLQFVEKVYRWTSRTYATVNSISKLVSTTFITFTSFVLVKRFKMAPKTLMLIGLVSVFAGQCLIGTFPVAWVYYIALPVGSLAGLVSISIRAELSVLVKVCNIGKIYSLLTTLETLFPFVGGVIYSELFVFTLTTYPGLVYHFSAFTFLVSTFVLMSL